MTAVGALAADVEAAFTGSSVVVVFGSGAAEGDAAYAGIVLAGGSLTLVDGSQATLVSTAEAANVLAAASAAGASLRVAGLTVTISGRDGRTIRLVAIESGADLLAAAAAAGASLTVQDARPRLTAANRVAATLTTA
jgi:hypothetical protein